MSAGQTYHQWQTDALAAAGTNTSVEGDDASFATLPATTDATSEGIVASNAAAAALASQTAAAASASAAASSASAASTSASAASSSASNAASSASTATTNK